MVFCFSSMSDSMNIKKGRSKNFTYIERCAFVDILTKYWDILENKKTNSETLRKKEVAWSRLVQEFNAFPQVEKRNSKQLRFFYDNFKSRTKKKYKFEELKRLQTGLRTIISNDESHNKLINLFRNKNHPKNSSVKRLPSSSLFQKDDTSISTGTPQENEPVAMDAIQEEKLHSSVIPVSFTPIPVVLSEQTEPVVKTEIEPDEQEIPTVPVEAEPPVQRKQSPSAITMKKIAVLADNRNKIIEMEMKLLENSINKDSELKELKMKVQREKLRAYEAKRLYYEAKLESCKSNENS